MSLPFLKWNTIIYFKQRKVFWVPITVETVYWKKKWLVPPITSTVLPKKCWFCNFHAGFGHFAPTVSLKPTSHGKPSIDKQRVWWSRIAWVIERYEIGIVKLHAIWKIWVYDDSGWSKMCENHEKFMWVCMFAKDPNQI